MNSMRYPEQFGTDTKTGTLGDAAIDFKAHFVVD
jgi:hypothetical protein